MSAFPGSIAFDEYGRPFIILRDQANQKRLTGNDAIKVSFYPRIPSNWMGINIFRLGLYYLKLRL